MGNVEKKAIKVDRGLNFTLSCLEGELNRETSTCIITETIARVNGCPSGYIDQGNGTCEATTTVSTIQTCQRGYDIGTGCRVNLSEPIEYRCPPSHRRDLDGVCYSFTTSYVDFQNPCRDGYRQESNRCYLLSDVETKGYYCPTNSWTLSGSTCYITITESYVTGCPSSFTLQGGVCRRTLTTTVGLTVCPEDYIEKSEEVCEKVTFEPAVINCPAGKIYNVERNNCI